eukprot:10554-Heterococcus_DN1.PRE.2
MERTFGAFRDRTMYSQADPVTAAAPNMTAILVLCDIAAVCGVLLSNAQHFSLRFTMLAALRITHRQTSDHNSIEDLAKQQ